MDQMPTTTPCAPVTTADRQAALSLLADMVAAGVRVVARGEGAVHAYGPLPPALHDRFSQHHATLDRLAAWVRWGDRGRPRVTLASTLLAGLEAAGVSGAAAPDGRIVWTAHAAPHRTLLNALRGVQAEMWFRLAVHLPPPTGSAEIGAGGLIGSTSYAPAEDVTAAGLAALRDHCRRRADACEQAARPASRPRAAAGGARWRGWERAVIAILGGDADVDRGALAGLLAHAARQGELLARRRYAGGRPVDGPVVTRWREWAAELCVVLERLSPGQRPAT